MNNAKNEICFLLQEVTAASTENILSHYFDIIVKAR